MRRSSAARSDLASYSPPAHHHDKPAQNGTPTDRKPHRVKLFLERVERLQVLAAIALTSAVVSGLPPIAHSPLSISCTRTQVTGRIGSPSTETIASVTF